jgi:hypothetical protein
MVKSCIIRQGEEGAMKRKLYSVWKEPYGSRFMWKVQMPKGLMSFWRKRDALAFAKEAARIDPNFKGGE